MAEQVKLSTEKKFELEAFKHRIAGLSKEELRLLCLSLHQELICQAAVYQELIKVKWGMDAPGGKDG